MDKYQNRYRISSVRLKNWNYANPGMYFITICCQNRVSYFGRIITPPPEPDKSKQTTNNNISIAKACLQPTPIGQVATEEWLKTPQIRPDMHIELGAFIVMPNHFHAILIIGNNIYNHETPPAAGNSFGPQKKNLASVIRGYKSAVTCYARKNNIIFGWQANYHEHIIRSYQEFVNITEYIHNNPAKWANDVFFGQGSGRGTMHGAST